jgi:hypothetical protein
MFIEGMLCNHPITVANFPLRYRGTKKPENFLAKVKTYYQTDWFKNQTASWKDRHQPEFTEVLTKFGYGFAFNMMQNSELFTDK